MGIFQNTAHYLGGNKQQESFVCQDADALAHEVELLYRRIAELPSLSPSPEANLLFSTLVLLCRQPVAIDVNSIPSKLQVTRSHLIRLCAEAEGYLEKHFANLLISKFENPLDHITSFPYYENYVKLARLEYRLLAAQLGMTLRPADCIDNHPRSIAFLGSGPLPLTSIVLAKNYFPTTHFHNYDIDPVANSMASKLVHPDLSQRMSFNTTDVMKLDRNHLTCYDVVYLAALVGMDTNEKSRLIQHLSENMKPGALLILRSAHGARAFLYPVVKTNALTDAGFEILSIYHPLDDVINSVIVVRRKEKAVNI